MLYAQSTLISSAGTIFCVEPVPDSDDSALSSVTQHSASDEPPTKGNLQSQVEHSMIFFFAEASIQIKLWSIKRSNCLEVSYNV